jgi:lipoprotein-releasing system permease protein
VGIDLIVLWLIGKKLRPRGRWMLFAGWMVVCLVLAAVELTLSFRIVQRPFQVTPPGLQVGLRVAGVLAILEAYFLSTFLWLPKLFDQMELSVTEVLVAVRQLRARKSGFLTVISFLAFFGVGLGAFALCMTISVMGGFGNDLKRKILGNNAHVVVDRERGGFTEWSDILRQISSVPDVQTVTPLVQGEVMITSQTNLSGVILRGIDPASTGTVRTLRHDLIRGRVDYLTEPERLNHLTAWERRPVTGRGEEELAPPPGVIPEIGDKPPARRDAGASDAW